MAESVLGNRGLSVKDINNASTLVYPLYVLAPHTRTLRVYLSVFARLTESSCATEVARITSVIIATHTERCVTRLTLVELPPGQL